MNILIWLNKLESLHLIRLESIPNCETSSFLNIYNFHTNAPPSFTLSQTSCLQKLASSHPGSYRACRSVYRFPVFPPGLRDFPQTEVQFPDLNAGGLIVTRAESCLDRLLSGYQWSFVQSPGHSFSFRNFNQNEMTERGAPTY